MGGLRGSDVLNNQYICTEKSILSESEGGNKKMYEESTIRTTKGKRVKVATTEYVSLETGEIKVFTEEKEKLKDYNFHKLWLGNLIEITRAIGNKKMLIALELMREANFNNQIHCSQRELAKKFGVSLDTVVRTFRILNDVNPNLVRKMKNGTYMISPNVIHKGSHEKREELCRVFREECI